MPVKNFTGATVFSEVSGDGLDEDDGASTGRAEVPPRASGDGFVVSNGFATFSPAEPVTPSAGLTGETVVGPVDENVAEPFEALAPPVAAPLEPPDPSP